MPHPSISKLHFIFLTSSKGLRLLWNQVTTAFIRTLATDTSLEVIIRNVEYLLEFHISPCREYVVQLLLVRKVQLSTTKSHNKSTTKLDEKHNCHYIWNTTKPYTYGTWGLLVTYGCISGWLQAQYYIRNDLSPKCKYFFWLLHLDHLLTNLFWRHISNTSIHPFLLLCGNPRAHDPELPPCCGCWGTRGATEHAICCDLLRPLGCTYLWKSTQGMPRNIAVVDVLWNIWKDRNNKVFCGVNSSPLYSNYRDRVWHHAVGT